jgi:hypothetical protein
MKFEDLFETGNRPVIVVDVQPAYSNACNHIVEPLVEFLNGHNGKILYFINGDDSGLSDDNQYTVMEYLSEYGLDSDKMHQIQWHDKGYGWLRAWMDSGVQDSTIIRTLRYMYMHRINDSRDLDEEVFNQLVQGEYEYDSDPLIVAPFEISLLKKYNNCYICGGGRNECLKEVQLMMNAFNIRYTMIQSLIY